VSGPRLAVVVFPGTWSERDFAHVATSVLGWEPRLVWHTETDIGSPDAVALPGGFAHGDHLRTGAIARFSPVMRAVEAFATAGGPVIGSCNGFQVLTEAGLLPGVLLRNASLKFVCRNVTLKVENSQTLFTSGYEAGQTLSVPVAHGDGNYFAEEATLDRMEERGQIAFRYVGANPNGSARDIAGIFNETKNVLGMMPHPENAIDPLQGSTDGRPLFDGLVQALS
jgi:phosphoribosylformylglycinamidine synthase subunit PurQ / glutaminase